MRTPKSYAELPFSIRVYLRQPVYKIKEPPLCIVDLL